MSSADGSSQELSSDIDPQHQSRVSSRQHSRAPGTPLKRRRIESVEPSRVRKYYLEGKYNDAYRILFNEDVSRIAAPFVHTDGPQHYSTQYGVSTWSAKEQAALFAALERLGKDDIAGIAQAVGTKTITETHELLLLLKDAATEKGSLGLTMRDVPSAIEIGQECTEELDVMAEALAWYQEQWEVAEEQKRYGDHWLISPSIAEDIEKAINGVSRPVSTQPTTPVEPETPRTGPGVAGSCERCKRHKIRCDRKIPCTTCARMKRHVVCEYKPSKRNPLSVDATPQPPNLDQTDEHFSQHDIVKQPQILQAIPQADLLHAENMLLLSKDLFMNRSPDIPSPWPHWSSYASEQVPEPSIMRTAFNDLHTLAVSVTKRLVQTAITQATSRLRSQRRRSKKGVMPFVKTRDIFSAIDVLGLKRNGRSQWTGVARRCHVRVFDEHRTTRFKVKQHEISWDQAEQILGLYDAATTSSNDYADAAAPISESEGEDGFKRRAARLGTPLPMEHLSISHSDSEAESEETADENDSSLVSTDDEYTATVKRDSADRVTSVELEHVNRELTHRKQNVEQFDQDARRQEEHVLSNRLGLAITAKNKSPDLGPHGDDTDDTNEGLVGNTDDWRDWTDYRAPWEEYRTPVPHASFVANEKPRPALPPIDPDDESDISSAASPQRPRKYGGGTIELQARNPRDYAALQTGTYDTHQSDLSEPGSEDADVPAQSIEDVGTARNTRNYDAMEWEA